MSDEKHTQSKAFDALNTRGLVAKREYVQGLERRRDPEAVSLLVECLCDESSYLRALAEHAFLRLGAEAGPVLLPLLEQGLWFTRVSAAHVLGELGYAPAVPGLLRLSEDANASVADMAREALTAIGRAGGAVRIAHVLHRTPPDVRRRRMEELGARDRAVAERVERLMGNEELMAVEDAAQLTDDHPAVRASEDGFEWEVLTSPAPPEPDAPPAGGRPSPQPPERREDEGGPGA